MAETVMSDVLDHFVENTEGDKVSLGDLLRALDTRSFGPLLLVPALIALSPVGAVPGMSIVTGSLIILIAGQMFFTRHPWLPSRLLNFSFPRTRLEDAVKKIQPWVKWMERALGQRLVFLTKTPADYVIAVISILLALTFYPLALLPGAVALPSFTIALLAVALTARDGLLALLGFAGTGGTAWCTYYFWPFS